MKEVDEKIPPGIMIAYPPYLADVLKRGLSIVDDDMMVILLTPNKEVALRTLREIKEWISSLRHLAEKATPSIFAISSMIACSIDPGVLNNAVVNYIIGTLLKVHGEVLVRGFWYLNNQKQKIHAVVIIGSKSSFVKKGQVDFGRILREIVNPLLRAEEEEEKENLIGEEVLDYTT